MDFLEKLKATYVHALDGINDDFKKLEKDLHSQYLQEGLTSEQATRRARGPREAFVERGKRFELWFEGKLKYLTKMFKIESAATQEEVKDEDGGEWDNGARGLALYAMLRFAGLPKGFKITAVAKLASLITGRSQRKLENAIRNADGGSFSDEDREAVAEQFDEMGMQEIAAKVRRKFYKIGTGYRTGTKSRS